MEKRVLVVGAKGKMGSAVCEVLKNDYQVIKVDKDDKMNDFEADLVIDFGSAESSVMSAEYAIKTRVPLIVGSTGQSESELKKIKQAAKVTPILICSNFSIGMVLVRQCIEKVLKASVSDICIFEKHHRAKKDAPSGTAKTLQKFICEQCDLPVQVLAERGGEEIGTHKIDFYFGSELISISHQAFSRKAFAEGVLLAAKFMLSQSQPQMFHFDEIVKENFD